MRQHKLVIVLIALMSVIQLSCVTIASLGGTDWDYTHPLVSDPSEYGFTALIEGQKIGVFQEIALVIAQDGYTFRRRDPESGRLETGLKSLSWQETRQKGREGWVGYLALHFEEVDETTTEVRVLAYRAGKPIDNGTEFIKLANDSPLCIKWQTILSAIPGFISFR